MKHRILTFFSICLSAILLIAILLFGLSQTPWFQNKLKIVLQTEAKKEGIDLEITQMKVIEPFKWSVKHVLVQKEKDLLEIRGLEFKIAPLSFLRNKVNIQLFSSEELNLSFFPSSESSLPFPLPFDFEIRKLALKKVSLKNLQTNQTFSFSLSGKVKLGQTLEEIEMKLLAEEDLNLNEISLDLIASQKKNKVKSELYLTLKNPDTLSFFFPFESLPPLDLVATLKGPLQGEIPFTLESHVDIPSLNATFSLKSQGLLSLSENHPFLSIQHCEIKNKDFDLSGNLVLSHEFTPLSADLALSIKEKFPLLQSLPFQGDFAGKLHLDKSSFLATLYSPLLKIEHHTFEPSNLQISATKEKKGWRGSLETRLEHPSVPLKQTGLFALKEKEIDFPDFTLFLGDAKLSGTGSLSLEDLSYQASFFLLADQLRPFRLFFPSSEIDGKLGGSFSLRGEKKLLSVTGSCLLKNIRYQNTLMDSLQIETDMENILSSPSGSFSCEAKNIFFRDMLLSQVFFISEPSNDPMHSYFLSIHGDWKQELQVKSEGFWQKKGGDWSLEVNDCEGSLLNESFSLNAPFSFEKSSTHITLNPSKWSVGAGSFSAEFTLSKDFLDFKSEAAHLPLGILGVLYPKMAFEGSASFQSALSGSPTSLKGHFFSTLEKADFSKNSAKGSLQIHFNPIGAQIHSHLYATKNQFLDATATLPLTYSFLPFSFEIDPLRPIASEITMQGAVEDIFDFVNAASHKASGWITGHLFLSGTLKKPSLLGSLKCEQASYENYFSGTYLKEVEAEFSASQNLLELSSLKGTDEKEGTLNAQGSLALSPDEHFPFELNAHLNSMHALRSDVIDASLSGSLNIKGNALGAKASGELKTDQATFKIVDELLFEIPTLPVTYINKPISLKTSSLENSTPYPLDLDLELSSEGSVFVEGRGLKSTWQGNVQIKGSAANPIAKGSLVLKQGEFAFSGKTFTLKQGEISFFDKPQPGAYLRLSGELALPSATILAQMQGPLTSPTLTFQSIPALPTSSILSLILFDKDISEISALQALQLAQTIMSLSGNGGPGVLDSIRKKIGVDRLNIVGKDGTDEISVQIGWYLNHGITLSLSQSATSSDVTVEVDLKNGFIFQAETQNQEEGKFSLKWNKNY